MSDMQISDLSMLLTQIDAIYRKNRAVYEATGENYNLFRELGIGKDELIFSKMLRSLLKTRTGGLHEAFIKSFLESIIPDSSVIDTLDLNSAKVVTERSIGRRNRKEETGGRIDIILEIHTKKQYGHTLTGFVIENKIEAKDQPSQMVRYSKYCKDHYHSGNYYLFYLTKDGKLPSPESFQGKTEILEINSDFYCISYQEHILNWLTVCYKLAVSYPLLREGIHHFLNQIKRLTRQDMTAMNEAEIIKVLRNDSNLEIATLLVEGDYINRMKKQVFLKEYLPVLTSFAENNNLLFYLEQPKKIDFSKVQITSKDAIRLIFKRQQSDTKAICIEFQGAGLTKLVYGIRNMHGSSSGEFSEDDEVIRENDRIGSLLNGNYGDTLVTHWWFWVKRHKEDADSYSRLKYSEPLLEQGEDCPAVPSTLVSWIQPLLPVLE